MNYTNIMGNSSIDDSFSQQPAKKFSTIEEPVNIYLIAIITAIYLAFFIVGLVGNVITCIVIICNKSMHTVPNCYLFNLAMSDLLLLLSGVPYDIVTSWEPYKYDIGSAGCFLRGWTAETSTNVSILTITVFTFERYLAVCRPITAQVMSKVSRAVKLIIVIWIISMLCSGILACQFEQLTLGDEYKCIFNRSIPYSFDILALIFFVIPLMIITLLYILIGRSLQNSNKMKKCRSNNSDSKNILKMLVVIVVVFFISWAPFQAQRMWVVHEYDLIDTKLVTVEELMSISDVLTLLSGICYYFSGAMNPIIYNIMSHKFRDAFKETIVKIWCFKREKSSPLSLRQTNVFSTETSVSGTLIS